MGEGTGCVSYVWILLGKGTDIDVGGMQGWMAGVRR